MKLSPPKNVTWWIAVVLIAVGLIGKLAKIAFVSPNAFWFVFVGAVLLVVATLLKDL